MSIIALLAISFSFLGLTIDQNGIELSDSQTFGYESVATVRVVTDAQTVTLSFEEGRSHALAGTTAVSWSALGIGPQECVHRVELANIVVFDGGTSDPLCLTTSESFESYGPDLPEGWCGRVEDFGPHGPCPDLWPICSPTECVGEPTPIIELGEPTELLEADEPIADQVTVNEPEIHDTADHQPQALADTGSRDGLLLVALIVLLLAVGATFAKWGWIHVDDDE